MVCLFMSPYQVPLYLILHRMGSQMSFRVEGPEDAQITVELEAEAQYEVYLDGSKHRQNGDQPWRKAFFQRRAWKWLSC